MKEYLIWLVAGIEDGWIKADQKTFRQYLIAKEILNEIEGTS